MRHLFAAIVAVGLLFPTSASALEGFGVRLGIGTGFPNDEAGGDDVSVLPFAGGVGYALGLGLLDVEIDAMYLRRGFTTTVDTGAGKKDFDGSDSWISIPILARVGLPMIPLLRFGAGLDARINIGAEFDGESDFTDPVSGKKKSYSDNYESFALYLPVFVGVDIDLAIMELSVDARFNAQLMPTSKEQTGSKVDEGRVHELMLFAGAFF